MGRMIVFSGHRIDAPGRLVPRFPQRCVDAVASWIGSQLNHGDRAISALADGGDILFAEACRALGLAHHVILPLPPNDFLAASVAPGEWQSRFRHLWDTTPEHQREVLVAHGSDPFDAGNRAMIDHALERPGPRLMLAVWDGVPGLPGGTGSMVSLARAGGLPLLSCDPMRIRT